jgi:hypothetical protein
VRKDSRLRREVIAPDGPDRRDAVAAYRRRRKAVERGKRFLVKVRSAHEFARDLDSGDVIDELDLLIKALEETL